MPFPTIAAKNAAGTDVIINTLPNAGRAAAAESLPAALSTEDKAALDLLATAALQGALTETAPASDTASSGLNGRLQRIAQRITSLIELLPTALGAGGGLKVDGSGTALPVTPAMSSAGHLSLQTAATGTNFIAFGSQACKQLTISNQSGTTLEFQQGGSGVAFVVPTGSFYTFFGLTNASQLSARRADTSNTQVTITARWES